MGQTQLKSHQIFDGGVKKDDVNTTESGQAVITKIIAGSNVTISASTGVDAGTGEVTISASGGTSFLEEDVNGDLQPVL